MICQLPLSYFAEPRFSQRRRLGAGALALACLIAALAALRLGWPTLTQAHYLWKQHAWLQHQLPDKQVVLEDDPIRAAALVAGDHRYAFRDYLNGCDHPSPAGLPAGYVPADLPGPAWAALGHYQAVVFMHGRSAAGGPPRLVIVIASSLAPNPNGRRFVMLAGFACSPASLSPGSRPVRVSHFTPLLLPEGHQTRARILAAQPDPANAARFTIPYDLDSKPGVIEGELLATDELTLRTRTQ
jgi:hypothetical protein